MFFKTKTRQLLTIVLGVLVISLLAAKYQASRASQYRVDASGNLTFTFNGLPPNAPVFTLDDFKPGDCYTRDVIVKNNGVNSALVAVGTDQITNTDNLGSVVYLTISQNGSDLYGSGGSKTVNQFFDETQALVDGLPLNSVAPNAQETFHFTVCMPTWVGNEFQKKALQFDLIFGRQGVDPTPTPSPTPIPVPPECQALLGKIDHVIYGTEGNDNIHATVDNDLIYALGGNDRIDASGGDDCVIAGPGNDTVFSEDGNDIVVGGEGNDTIFSGSGNDIIFGNDGNDKLDAGSGNDFVYAGPGNDKVSAGTGDDYVEGGEGTDTISGSAGNDTLYGGPGDDVLDGGSGNDHLYGNEDKDKLLGGPGDDYLDGGPQDDVLNGHTGTDTCLNGEVQTSCEL